MGKVRSDQSRDRVTCSQLAVTSALSRTPAILHYAIHPGPTLLLVSLFDMSALADELLADLEGLSEGEEEYKDEEQGRRRVES